MPNNAPVPEEMYKLKNPKLKDFSYHTSKHTFINDCALVRKNESFSTLLNKWGGWGGWGVGGGDTNQFHNTQIPLNITSINTHQLK